MILFCLWRFVINDYLRQHPFNFTSFVYVFPWFCSHSGPCGALGHRGPPWGAMASDEDLELQAKAMAEKTLPSSLPPAARAAKLPAITAKILERLRKQRDEAEKPKVTGNGNSEDPNPPPAPPPPPEGKPPAPIRIDGVELFGDELWFDDPETRKRLRDSVIEAHREEKILVGPPADEVERICPSNGRILGAGVP